MEDLELIEEEFSKKVEFLDKEFISNLKEPKGESVSEIEKKYRANLKIEIDKFQKKFDEFLAKHKQTKEDYLDPGRMLPEKEEDQNEKKLDMSKPFVASHLNMEFTKEQISKTKKQISSFRSYVKRRNFFHKHVPGFLVFSYFRLRIFWKRFRLLVSNTIFRIETGTRQDFESFKEIMGNFFKKTFSFIKSKGSSFVKWVKEKILGKKTEGNEVKKSEDAKIAEKLLSKK